ILKCRADAGRLKGGPPAVALVGAIRVSTGGGGGVTVNVSAAEVRPEPFWTVTGTVPTTAPAMFTVAVSCVSETRVVVSPRRSRRIPAVASEALPGRLSMKFADPTPAEVGVIAARIGGGGGLSVNGSPVEGMPVA